MSKMRPKHNAAYKGNVLELAEEFRVSAVWYFHEAYIRLATNGATFQKRFILLVLHISCYCVTFIFQTRSSSHPKI